MLEGPKLVITYLMMVPVLFGIDLLWLGVVARDYYRKQLGSLMTENINWTAAIVFYLVFIGGIMYFAVLPGVEKESLTKTIMNGALFGGLAYATYDLTNLATLKGWPTQVVFVDILWGIVLSAAVATAGYYIASWVR